MKLIKVDKSIIKISSKSCVYKTDKFIKQTQGIAFVDLIINFIKNAIIEDVVNKKIEISDNQAIIVSTLNDENKFFIRLGKQINAQNLNNNDLIFYKYFGKEKKGRNQDNRFYRYINAFQEEIEFTFAIIKDDSKDLYNKLYILANSDSVNMPLLNKEQERIVKIEDNNVLVQGVAGSGKTNICIDKIVYGACRHYLGKTLYSTYSHALLIETKKKVEQLNKNIRDFINKEKLGKVLYLDDNKKEAVEKYLGVYIDSSALDYVSELEQISRYLYEKVDYKLIENFYEINEKEIADETYFIKKYIPNIKNYNVKNNLEKIKHLSFEIIYKEIFGMIYGTYFNMDNQKIISLKEYVSARKDCFNEQEANAIYMLALDYYQYLIKNNAVDNNYISRELIENIEDIEKYSLVVLDEVQDFTQTNLNFFKLITIKLFCVGDVLQMINPSYFSFAYLKRLMFDENLSNVIELKHNYRNSKKIERLIDELSKINIEQFGTHNFVIRGESVDSDIFTSAIYVNDGNFINLLNKELFYELTIVVSTNKKKKELLELMPRQEVLTVSEIKGLERNCIVLYDILSDNFEKWNLLKKNIVNKKKAEENSIYRYYFNLFYVGVSRAKQNLFVVERKHIDLFDQYFKNGFDNEKVLKAIEILNKVVKKTDIDEKEIQKRIEEFIKLEQYDNARFNAEKLPDEKEKQDQLDRIEIFERFVRKNQFKKAGIEFWKKGFLSDAKTQFMLSHDEKLIELIDACSNNNGQSLKYDIVQFYMDVKENEEAAQLIIDTLVADVEEISEMQNKIFAKIKNMKNR